MATHSSIDEPNYFHAYWKAVVRELGGDPSHKSFAYQVGSPQRDVLDGISLVRTLWTSMEGGRWASPLSVSEGNWAWRTHLSNHSANSPEVALERAVILQGRHEDWTYQMSTASGLHGPAAGKRRAIDLVRRHSGTHFSCFELKVGSDNPVYAAFEVLGYGLAYLHARLTGQRGTGPQDVMAAERLDLIVLGPRDWYLHPLRNGMRSEMDLVPLAHAIESGLSDLLREAPLAGRLGMGFRFESFEQGLDVPSTAAEIVRRF